MKLWLNGFLACPDDGAYPFTVKIFNWKTGENKFRLILNGYKLGALMNFFEENKPDEIQVYDPVYVDEFKAEFIDRNGVLEENKRLAADIRNLNIINITVSDEGIFFSDLANVKPVPFAEYIRYYTDILEELRNVEDYSDNKYASEILGLIKEEIARKLGEFLSDGSVLRALEEIHRDFIEAPDSEKIYYDVGEKSGDNENKHEEYGVPKSEDTPHKSEVPGPIEDDEIADEEISAIDEKGRIYINADASGDRRSGIDIDEFLGDRMKKEEEEKIIKMMSPAAADAVRRVTEVLAPVLQELLLLNYYLCVAEIEEGALTCPKCGYNFPIVKCIPVLLPKSHKLSRYEKEFFKRHPDLLA